MTESQAETFEYEGGSVAPSESEHFRFTVSETYVSDPIRIPITIVNGAEPGPTVFLSAAIHGDEVNGIEVVRHVADEFDHADLHGTLVCLHVVNVPGFNAQEREVPLDGEDLNRSFPGSADGNATQRIAHEVYENFVRPCDFGVDFHTSTRGRTNMLHARGNLDDDGVSRLAHAYAANVLIDAKGPSDSLRRAATEDDVPTIVVEMGEANRFQRGVIETAIEGVRSVFAELGLHPQDQVLWPGWRAIVDRDEKEWLRADAGGLVDMHVARDELVREGDRICTITNPFDNALTEIEAPFTGVLIGLLQTPVVSPGNPICHLAAVTASARRVLESRDEAP